MYHSNDPINTIIPYLKIATVMSKKFRDDKVPMDRQAYLKEVYVKAIQVVKHCISGKDNKSPAKLIDCIKGVISELPALASDSDFIKIRNVAFCIFIGKTNGVNMNDEERINFEEYMKYIKESGFESLEFTELNLLLHLKTIKLDNPVMKKFVMSIKTRIDDVI